MIFESLEVLARILFRCEIYERLYGQQALQATVQLNSSLVHLYVAVLQYLCSARRQLSLPTTGIPVERKVSHGGSRGAKTNSPFI